jgi:UMF1 family MFS transporter
VGLRLTARCRESLAAGVAGLEQGGAGYGLDEFVDRPASLAMPDFQLPVAARSAPPRFTAAAWIMLDWAASGFSTVLITLVVAYVEKVAFADRPWGLEPGVVWPWTLALAMLVSALVTPGVSAWADRRRQHKTALLTSVGVGAGALGLLCLAPPTARLAVLAGVILGNVGFDLAAVFTGSILATIAAGKTADRLSAWGFAAGYAGGFLALVIATGIVTAHDSFGLTTAGGLRAAFAFTGLWWLIFSLPAAVARFDDGHGAVHAASAAGELLAFARTLLRPGAAAGRHLAAVLGGSMLVLGAVQTAIAQFSSVALEEFQLEPAALVRLVLLVQAVALPGALAIGWISERIGRRAALVICLAGWIAVLTLAWFVSTVGQLHALAVLLALVLGGVQSVIRATVAEAAPEGRAGVTFGLLQVGTKLAGAAAGLTFGWLYLASGHPRAGLAALLVQILLGWWALRGMGDSAEGRQVAVSPTSH